MPWTALVQICPRWVRNTRRARGVRAHVVRDVVERGRLVERFELLDGVEVLEGAGCNDGMLWDAVRRGRDEGGGWAENAERTD